MRTKIIIYYDQLSTSTKILLNAISISIPFYFAAFLSSSVTEAYSKTNRTMAILIHFIIFIVLITVIIYIYRLLYSYYLAYKDKFQMEHKVIYNAFTLCDRRIIKQHKIIKESFSDLSKIKNLISSVDRIQEIIDDAYATFESNYGNQERIEERIDFEVTFMTLSYIDNKITIPCSANRNGRKPRSLFLRRDNPNIYNKTETAKIYKATRPNPIIVSDTSDKKYSELYPTQKQRIKSSIIYPILCEDNIVLGTLVVHCDRKGFFKNEDQKYWTDLLEIFAKRISVEKIKIDLMEKITRETKQNIILDHIAFF